MIYSLGTICFLDPVVVLRFNGDNVEEDLVTSEDDENDLVPKSLDNDFQLSELPHFQKGR